MAFAWSTVQLQAAPSCNAARKRWALALTVRPRAHFGTERLHGSQIARGRSEKGRMCKAANGSDRVVLQEVTEQTYDERRDRAYREGALFLRSLGISSQLELTRVLDIAMNPNSLFLDVHQSKLRGNASARLLSVDEDLRPVAEWLLSTGLSAEQVTQVILAHPPVLSYSPTEQLQPFFDELKGLGLPDPISIIARRPSLLGISLGDNVQRMVGFLLESGKSIEDIAEMLATTL